jgi:hypothetical protein
MASSKILDSTILRKRIAGYLGNGRARVEHFRHEMTWTFAALFPIRAAVCSD